MPRLLRSFFGADQKDTIQPNRYEGFNERGAIILQDRRGTRKAEIPNVDLKAEAPDNDPLAIYRPTGAKHVDAAKAMGNFTGWTYAAVNAVASEVANIQLRLYKISGKDHHELDDHPLLDLLESPNETMTGIEFKYTLMAHLELTGNSYWLIDGVTSDVGEPRALYPLDPGRMRVKLNKSVFPYRISHFEYTIDGNVHRFEPYQILHIKYVDPSDPFVGVGVPQTIPSWIDSDNYAMEYNRKFFINGAQVGLYIQTDTNVEGNIDRIKRSWGNRQEGNENAHKVPVLPKGVKLEHTGVTHKDMDFKDLAEATRDRILAGFRVSKTILGTAESDTNRATAETADYVFSKRTIKPKMLLVTSYLNEFLVSRYGDDLYLTFIDPTPEDKEFRTKEMQAAAGNLPIMTQNEARQTYLGLGPVDGGDRLMVPTTMEAAGQTEKPEGEDVTPQLAKTAEGWRTRAMRIRTGGKTTHSGSAAARRALADAFRKQLNHLPQFETKSVSELTKAEYREHWKRFADRSERAEAELRRVFDGINAKQKAEVLKNLPEATGVEKGLEQLFDVKEWIGITVDLATPILTSLAKDEAAAALSMIGAKHQDILADESARAALDRGISKMARSYNETTLEQLKNVLDEKLSQPGGTSLSELTNAVDGVYSFADERRAGLIAKTEAFRAANWANREAWVQSGVVHSLIWYTAEDDHVCAYCQELDGTKVGIEDKFFNDTYSDGMSPPRHPDCRCYVRPDDISIE